MLNRWNYAVTRHVSLNIHVTLVKLELAKHVRNERRRLEICPVSVYNVRNAHFASYMRKLIAIIKEHV